MLLYISYVCIEFYLILHCKFLQKSLQSKRKLKFVFRSNLFVIGTVGSHLSKLVRLAFYLAEIQEHIIDHSTKSLFYDSLRAVLRITAVEGRHVGIVLTVRKS
jgi:hypothetical protein